VKVIVALSPTTPARTASGPADLQDVGHPALLVLTGTVNRETDFGHWAGAIGAAVLRGARTTWN
jgi:hypothetical protein